ncbi:hypothetical protein DFJ74DRAFT_771576 [Hyaloraphidium curvatum]|nr:hypothetical protein DFJ74DRAFT_771576 [Hyaloraphidium curvatum]
MSRPALAATVFALLLAGAAAQSTTVAASATSGSATATRTRTTTAPGIAPTGVVNGFLPWPTNGTLVFNQTTGCQRWYIFVPKDHQLVSTACVNAGFAWAWIYDKDETTRGDTIPANITAENNVCLLPNYDQPPFNRDVRGRRYFPSNPGETTRQRCFTEPVPKTTTNCLSYDAVFYMYTVTNWTNATDSDGRPVAATEFKVPSILNITDSDIVPCGSWTTATGATSATRTGTATASTSRPGAAGPGLRAGVEVVAAAVFAAVGMLVL